MVSTRGLQGVDQLGKLRNVYTDKSWMSRNNKQPARTLERVEKALGAHSQTAQTICPSALEWLVVHRHLDGFRSKQGGVILKPGLSKIL
jgi:hypothetical protein